MIEQGTPKKGTENSVTEIEVSNFLPAGESYCSMGEILSSMDPGHALSVSGLESSAEKPVGKVTSSNLSVKRSAFWGRSNVSFYTFFIFTENYMIQMLTYINLRNAVSELLVSFFFLLVILFSLLFY